MRQWRQDWVSVAPPAPQEQQQQNDIWSIELLHGMPKDSSLLPPHSQELLHAARSGRLYKRPAPIEEDEADPEAILPEKADKKEDDASSKGFSIKVWKQIPRNVEGAAVSHLAKRRKNTVTIASRTVDDRVPGPTVTRATVRRVDAAGNPYTEEVTLAEGQPLVGEIISTRVEVAPGPGGDSLSQIPQPPKRRPPPPKRKSKAGPGRGKKKMRGAPPLSAAQPVKVAPPADGSAAVVPKSEGADYNVRSNQPLMASNSTNIQQGVKQEPDDATNQDSEMADGDDDDDDEDGDEGEDGEDGDETQGEGDQHDSTQGTNGDNSASQDHEMTDASPSKPIASESPDIEMKEDSATPERSTPPNPLNLAPPISSLAAGSPRLEGSPLKNVVVPSPTTEFPPQLQPSTAPEPVADTEPQALPEADNSPEAAAFQITEVPPSDAIPEPSVEAAMETEIETAPVSVPVAVTEAALAPIPASEAPATESTIAEPPSTIVGEAPETAVERDVPNLESFKVESSTEDALLPPPPEQVGNIATPGSEEPPSQFSGSGDKNEDIHPGEEALPEKPPLNHRDTGMTEDTIKPDDSASVNFPITDSGAPSEAAPSQVGGLAEDEPPTESVLAPISPAEAMDTDPSPPNEAAAAPVAEPDRSDGFAGDQGQQSEEKMESPVPAPAPETSAEPKPESEPSTTEAQAEPDVNVPPAQEEPSVVPDFLEEPKPDPEPQTTLTAEPEPELPSAPSAEPNVEPVAESLAEPVVEPKTEQSPEVKPESEPQPEADAAADSESRPAESVPEEAPVKSPPSLPVQEEPPVEEKKEEPLAEPAPTERNE